MKSREITTYWYDEGDGEHFIEVWVSADGIRDVKIDTDLSDLPEDQRWRVEERVAERYWDAEREEYEMMQCAQEDSRDE